MNVMKKKKKRIICLMLFICLTITYTACFVIARKNTRLTYVKYFDIGEMIVYGGVQYSFESNIYNADEMIQEFELEEYLQEIKKADNEVPALYIVTKVNAKKIESCPEADGIRDSIIIVNHYTNGAGKNYDLQSMIQNQKYKEIEELDIGEETEYYILNVVAKSSYCKKVWNHMKESVFYLELPDYESRQYITRVKVIDGKYGDFKKG